jgi:hypothetical protein
MVLRVPLVSPALLGPAVGPRPDAALRPLGLRPGARIRWTCLGCDSRLTAELGPAPACSCGGVVRPAVTR